MDLDTEPEPAVLPLARYQSLPKRDLHAHFNGCIPPATTEDLIQTYSVQIPEGFSLPEDLTITQPVSCLQEYFRPWHLLKRLPVGRQCFMDMLHGAAGALQADSVEYVELRNSPFNIAELNGICFDELAEWLVHGAEEVSAGSDIDIRWIVSFSRYRFDLAKARELLQAVARRNEHERIVGVDLSGNEDSPIDPLVAALFRAAKDEYGLGVTVHAGETGSTENIRWALTECKADRIGHGLAACSSQSLMERLREEDVCLEICLTSNRLTGRTLTIDEHPVRRFIAEQVPFVLCSDNPAIHASTLSRDYELLAQLEGGDQLIANMLNTQSRYAMTERRR